MKLGNSKNSTGQPKRIFVVDQFPISRMGLWGWLDHTLDLVICGEADNSTNAIPAIERLKPDVVVTEIMRAQDFSFIRDLRRRHRDLPILTFSFRDEDWYAPRALEAGADGYLMKGVSKEMLMDGIRSAFEGRVVLSPEMRARLLRKCRPAPRTVTVFHRSRRRHACERRC